MHIGVLEDDPAQAEFVTYLLDSAGYQYQHFDTGAAMLAAVPNAGFDLLVIDWELPDMTGLDVLAQVRSQSDWHVPVLFVTQRDSEDDIVRALEAGADDYMVKEVRERELLARINALIRRFGEDEDVLNVAHVELNKTERRVTSNGAEVDLTAKDFDLAWYLFNNIGRLLSRAQLLKDVWGVSADLNTRTVDVHMSRLRRRLDLGGTQGALRIRTVYQHGYRLERADAD